MPALQFIPLAAPMFAAGEAEVLLKRGQKFEVVAVEQYTAADGRVFRNILVKTVEN